MFKKSGVRDVKVALASRGSIRVRMLTPSLRDTLNGNPAALFLAGQPIFAEPLSIVNGGFIPVLRSFFGPDIMRAQQRDFRAV